MTVHPAALVLAVAFVLDEHSAPPRRNPAAQTHCECGWIGQDCDHATHQAEMLQRAGLLKEDT